MALTRTCPGRMVRGVPVGVHSARLDSTSSGMPMEVTRVVPVVNVALTQGPTLAEGTGLAQVGDHTMPANNRIMVFERI